MISKIVFGEPMKPIMVGECAWIRKSDGVMRTTTVIDANRVSATQLRFDTKNTRYILNIVPIAVREVDSV